MALSKQEPNALDTVMDVQPVFRVPPRLSCVPVPFEA